MSLSPSTAPSGNARSAVVAPGPTENATATTPSLVLQATEGGTLVVPYGALLLTAHYERDGDDLVLSAPGGGPVVLIRGFFALETPPALSTENGAVVDAALAEHLAGARAPGQYAAAGDAAGSEPIGRVAEISGEATATRVDGTKVTLTKDTPVYQGDVIETAKGAALEVSFVDQSTFSVGENGRMVLDELVFDPSTLHGNSTVSVLQGVFVFVSGEIAANNPEQMAIKTPVATIGIRGTAVAISAAQEGEQNKIVLLTEQSTDGQTTTGAVVITNQAGRMVLDEPFETTLVNSVFTAPATSFISPPNEVKGLVGQLGAAAPDSVQHLAPPASTTSPSESAGAHGQSGGTGEGSAPANTASDGAPNAPAGEAAAQDGAPPGEAPPLDTAMFAEEPGLFEDAAAVVAGMIGDGTTPPPGDAGPLATGAPLPDDKSLSLGGLPALSESALAAAVGAGLPAPPPDGGPSGAIGGSYGGIADTSFGGMADTSFSAYASAMLTSDPLAATGLSGGISAPADFGPSFGPDATFGFVADFAALLSFFAPPPPPPPTGTSTDFLAPPPNILNGLTLIGTSAGESLFGGNLNDFIDGRGGDDSLFGFDGNDLLIGGAGNDLIDGGPGFDKVSYIDALTSGVVVNLGSGFASGADIGVDSLVSIEAVLGTHFADTLTGSAGDDVLEGGGGNDQLIGGGGNDIYVVAGNGNPVNLTINDSADSSPADVLVMGSLVGDALPIDFDYTLSGSNLVIRHVLGNPSTEQGTIIAFATTGRIESFEFIDSFLGKTDLSLLLSTGGGTHTGTTASDFMAVGDGASTTLDGAGGDDYLVGNAGSDVLVGGAGNDHLNGDGGGDTLDGGIGDDQYLIIPTTATTELVTDSAGTDFLEIGGTVGFTANNNGSDLVLNFNNGTTVGVVNHFAGAPVEFLAFTPGFAFYSLATGTTGTLADDLIAGGAGSQTLSGDAGNDLLFGAGGADLLLGGAGNDILVGGAGADTLTGNGAAGEADRFRYFAASDGTAAANTTSGAQTGDHITDFETGVDRFEILNSAFGFGTTVGAAVNGTTFFSVSGYDGTNAPASGTAQAHFVFDPASLTLYHDDGNSGTGYTVIATVQAGGTVAAGDIQVSSLGGPSAY